MVSRTAGLFRVLRRSANTRRTFDHEGFDVSIYSVMDSDDALDEEDGF